MKSLLVVSTLFPNINDPLRGIFVKQRLLELRKHFRLRVVSPLPWIPWGPRRWRMDPARPYMIDGVEVWYPRYFRIPRLARSLDGLFFYLSLRRFFSSLVARDGCDAIIVHWAYPDAFAMSLMNSGLRKPLFIQVHGSDINVNARYRLRRGMIAFALRRAATVFSVAYQLQERIVALGVEPDRVCVAPNGVNHAIFAPRDRDAARAQLALPPQKKIVLFVGHLVEVKGPRYLLEAAAALSRRRGDLLFLVIGDGALRQSLRQAIGRYHLEDSVWLLGDRPHAEIPVWMASCDLLCLPSLSEGRPNVVIEALASGRPVVGTEAGDIPFLLTMSGGGYAVRPGDSQALADAVEKALAHEWDPEILARSVRDFTWENTAKTLCRRISAALPTPGEIDHLECAERP